MAVRDQNKIVPPRPHEIVSTLCAAIPDSVRKTNKMLAWAHRCHEASILLVKSGLLPSCARVARGWHPQVRSQHSWITLGDCYNPDVTIIDPTLWSYLTSDIAGKVPMPPTIAIGCARQYDGRPHGFGDIWKFGRPDNAVFKGERFFPKEPKNGWSAAANEFLRIIGPMAHHGWGFLASKCPVGGWPAGEIIEAMHYDKRLTALVPVDRLGMLTDINPSGLYLPGEEKKKGKR